MSFACHLFYHTRLRKQYFSEYTVGMGYTVRVCVIAALALLALQALVLLAFGQPAICACGYIKFWEGVVQSFGNSQHLTDWYTFSHVIHGFLFYLGLWYFFPRFSVFERLVLALGIEVAWEIAENTPYVINLYRQQALAAGYSGDSVLNSISDSLAMILGFILAARLPAKATVAIALLFEVWVGYSIHDNLALNILNFIHSSDAIRTWQSGV